MYFKTLAMALAMSLPTGLLAQSCSVPGSGGTMTRFQSYFAENQIALFHIQLQVNAVRGRQVLTPDGIWGPASAAELCRALDTYVAINGMGPGQLIASDQDVAHFARWMGSMARSSLNPGAFETPD